jgi:hypothetical protein
MALIASVKEQAMAVDAADSAPGETTTDGVAYRRRPALTRFTPVIARI